MNYTEKEINDWSLKIKNLRDLKNSLLSRIQKKKKLKKGERKRLLSPPNSD